MYRLLKAICRLNIKEYIHNNAINGVHFMALYFIYSFIFSLKMAFKSRNLLL